MKKQNNKDLERKIKIKDAWLQRIVDIGFDYDGYNKYSDLKKIIDELVDYAQKGISNDDTTPVYFSCDSVDTKYNILLEEIKDKHANNI